MLKDEGAHGVGVTFGADGKLACGCPNLVTCLRTVRIMTVAALDESNVHPVTVGPREFRFLRSVTTKTQVRLRLHQHEVHVARFVGTMTSGATDAIRQVLRLGKVLRLEAGLMALGADGGSLRRTQCLETNNLGDIAPALYVGLCRSMTGLASVSVALNQNGVWSVGKVLLPDFLMAGLADVSLGVLTTCRRRQRRGSLGMGCLRCWIGLGFLRLGIGRRQAGQNKNPNEGQSRLRSNATHVHSQKKSMKLRCESQRDKLMPSDNWSPWATILHPIRSRQVRSIKKKEPAKFCGRNGGMQKALGELGAGPNRRSP